MSMLIQMDSTHHTVAGLGSQVAERGPTYFERGIAMSTSTFIGECKSPLAALCRIFNPWHRLGHFLCNDRSRIWLELDLSRLTPNYILVLPKGYGLKVNTTMFYIMLSCA